MTHLTPNSPTPHRTDELTEIFHRAVRKVQEENRRLGVPNDYSFNGQLYFELPNGELVRERPPVSHPVADDSASSY